MIMKDELPKEPYSQHVFFFFFLSSVITTAASSLLLMNFRNWDVSVWRTTIQIQVKGRRTVQIRRHKLEESENIKKIKKKTPPEET